MYYLTQIAKPENLLIVVLILTIIHLLSRTKFGRFLLRLNPVLVYKRIEYLEAEQERLNNEKWELSGEVRELKQKVEKLTTKVNKFK